MSSFTVREGCPVCGGTALRQIYSAPYASGPVHGFIESHYREQGTVDWSRLAGADYVVAECGACDLLFQQTVPTPDLLTHVYTEMIAPGPLAASERARMTLDAIDKVAGEMAHLFRLTGKAPADITLLDYGMGYGRWARAARGMGATVYATELGEDKRRFAESIGVRIIDDAEIDRMQFDIVHTEQVLEHLLEPGRDFARLARAAAILFKVAVPARRNASDLLAAKGLPAVSPYWRETQGERMSREDDAFISVQPLEHINAFSTRTMEWLAARNDMRLVDTVRKAVVGVDLTSGRGLAASLANLARMGGKMLLKPANGYFLFRRFGA